MDAHVPLSGHAHGVAHGESQHHDHVYLSGHARGEGRGGQHRDEPSPKVVQLSGVAHLSGHAGDGNH